MGQETEGRRGCRVRVLKAGVFLKIYTVYKTGRTVASVTNDLPSDIRFYYILQVRICAISCDVFSYPVCETISEDFS